MIAGRLRRAAAKHRLATIATVYLAVLVAAAAAAPLVAPYDPEHQDLTQVLSGPAAEHWLGTDRLGRDVFSRLLYGGRVTLLDVAEATVVFLVLGIAPGVVAGYRGGWLDRVVVRFADLLLAVPAIVVLLMIVAVFPGNDLATMITLGVIGSPGLLRIVRGSTLAIRGELYVKAARLSGLRGGAILRRHILPRLAGPIIVQASLFCATALLAESGLSFLGLSRPETKGPSWGNMVAEASNAMSSSPWLLVPTGGALMLTVMAFGLVGDAARDSVTGRTRNTRNKTPTPKMVYNDSDLADEVALATTGAEPPALSVRNLAVALPGPVTILRGVTFDIGPGEAVGIVGESGCGKSITAKAILGLLPAGGAVTAGSARFDGADLTSLNQRVLTRIRGAGIGLISQDPVNSLDPTFTVGSQLREVIRRHRPQSRRRATGRALELLRRSGCPTRPRRWPPTRTNCPAAWPSASRSPSHWPPSPRCSSPTSRPPHWTSPCRRDPRPAPRPARNPRHGDPPHHPRLGRGRRGLRPRRGHVRRRGRRDRHRRGPVHNTAAPLHQGTSRRQPARRHPRPAAPRHRRQRAAPHRLAGRLPLRPPLPTGHQRVHRVRHPPPQPGPRPHLPLHSPREDGAFMSERSERIDDQDARSAVTGDAGGVARGVTGTAMTPLLEVEGLTVPLRPGGSRGRQGLDLAVTTARP